MLTKKEIEAIGKEMPKEYLETKPNEVIHLEEGSMIHNFEVDFKVEEELAMTSGIRGIKALRLQRALIEK